MRESFLNAAKVLVQSGKDEEALEMAANIWRLWVSARDIPGGRKFLSIVLDGTKRRPSRNRTLALYGDGLLSLKEGKLEDSEKRNQEALEIAKEVRDLEALVLANLGLSRIAFEDSDYEHARVLATKALELTRGLDPALAQAPLHAQGQSNRMLGDYDAAAGLLTKSLELNRRIGDTGMVIVELQNLGHVEAHRGNFDIAERLFNESRSLESSDDPYSAAMIELNEAVIAYGKKDFQHARKLLTNCMSTLEKSGIDAAQDDRFEIDFLDQKLRE